MRLARAVGRDADNAVWYDEDLHELGRIWGGLGSLFAVESQTLPKSLLSCARNFIVNCRSSSHNINEETKSRADVRWNSRGARVCPILIGLTLTVDM
jgi:hypothetical protein